MAENKLKLTDFLQFSQTLPVIDVRSPAEYEHGHIPRAFNLPLFTNEERSIVGTFYLKKGSGDAMIKGLEMIGPKMKDYAERALTIAENREALVHCWRGGMRSNSMAWLLETIGIKTYVLDGGYKVFRRFVLDSFSKPLKLVVIGGMTGSGKTEVLEALASKGKQVINLERLASHRGSVFGNIGMPSQPTTEQFENDLFECIQTLDERDLVYIEDESLAIGKVFIPQPLFQQMLSAQYINLVIPFDKRVQNLIKGYTSSDINLLLAGVKRIEKRLGLEVAAKVTGYIQNNQMKEAVELILGYYDKAYAKSMNLLKRQNVTELSMQEENAEEIAKKIITHPVRV
jgi:tRNA 2-selenouridine synthase